MRFRSRWWHGYTLRHMFLGKKFRRVHMIWQVTVFYDFLHELTGLHSLVGWSTLISILCIISTLLACEFTRAAGVGEDLIRVMLQLQVHSQSACPRMVSTQYPVKTSRIRHDLSRLADTRRFSYISSVKAIFSSSSQPTMQTRPGSPVGETRTQARTLSSMLNSGLSFSGGIIWPSETKFKRNFSRCVVHIFHQSLISSSFSSLDNAHFSDNPGLGKLS
jgi:hypothetical protein